MSRPGVLGVCAACGALMPQWRRSSGNQQSGIWGTTSSWGRVARGAGLVMCHPGFADAELQRLDPLTTLREKEYAYLASDEFSGMLATHGVALT
jgi:hypothetical protein